MTSRDNGDLSAGSPDAAPPAAGRLARWMPGWAALRQYQRADLSHDISAGLAVAAVAIPGSVASAQLAGLPPVAGLYASTLPMLAYALFGTSRQLLVGPNAAGAAILAAGVAPLALGDAALHADMVIVLSFFVGVLCVLASFLRLGALADLLSKPILVGFMNGVALNVVLSQIGTLFGLRIEASGLVPRAWEFLGRLSQTHWPTLAVGLGTMTLLLLAPRWLPRLPAALVALVAASLTVHFLGLEAMGVGTLGPIAGGLPQMRLPQVPAEDLPLLLLEAAGLALVLFSTTMVAARSFADRNRYEIDADREVAALGMANIAGALAQGMAVSGTNSRTAVGEAAGGRTQVTGLVAGAIILAVAVALAWPLQFIPRVALAAVLVVSGAMLFNWTAMALIGKLDRREFLIGMSATVGVIVFGLMQAILIAVALALISFVQQASRPRASLLGRLPGVPGLHPVVRHPEATLPPGLAIFQFDGPVIFVSAPYFKREALRAAAAAGPNLKWFVLDLSPVNLVDATGVYAIQDLFDQLRARGIVVGAAARETQWADWAAERGLADRLERVRFFATPNQAVRDFERDLKSGVERDPSSDIERDSDLDSDRRPLNLDQS